MGRPAYQIASLVFAGFLSLWPVSAQAGAPTDQLRESIGKLIKVIEDPALTPDAKARARRTSIREVTNGTFDFAESARRSLARHWKSLTDKEREEFTTLFADLPERSYVSRIEQYKGGEIIYTGEAIYADQATVRTKLISTQGAETRVDYRMLGRGDRWLVYDVAFEGLSLIANYRAQFSRILQASSYQELVKKMKAEPEGFTFREQGTPTWVARMLFIVGLLSHLRQSQAPGGATLPAASDWNQTRRAEER